MDTGVRVVGSPIMEEEGPEIEWAPLEGEEGPTSGPAPAKVKRGRKGSFGVVSVLAILGLLGTLVFALLWAGSSSSGSSDPAMTTAAKAFLIDLTNFNAKTVDGDFTSIGNMATGTFSSQATKFFNSSIRSQLESALAESRGQIRSIYTQSDNGSTASVYAVVDQVYVNNKISTPQSDVLRVVVNLQKLGSTWKISDVTVLEGATPASAGTSSGAAGSQVPGQ